MVAKRCTLGPLFLALLLCIENVLEGIIVSRVSSPLLTMKECYRAVTYSRGKFLLSGQGLSIFVGKPALASY